MKKTFASLLIFFVGFTLFTFAGIPSKVNKNSAVYHQIESNYLKGLNSDNMQLKVSCAYFLGEMKSEKALIPLMALFRNAENEGSKLVAAWSLLKIGDSRGVYLVKRTIDLNECGSDTGCMLRFLYMDYYLKTYGHIDRS